MTTIDPQVVSAAIIASTDALNEIVGLWPTDYKITLIARLPGRPEADFILSNDDLPALRAAIERYMLIIAQRGTPQ